MSTTIKRVTIALTKEDLRLLERACTIAGETPSDILKRGLVLINNLLKEEPINES